MAAQVAQHGAGLDRGELVFVTQQHQPGLRGQGSQQRGHHLQMHHRRLIDDQHVQRQRVGGVEPELPRLGPCAQQRVQGARRPDLRGPVAQRPCRARPISQALLQAGQRRGYRLLEPGGGLAGGRGQRHAQPLRRRIDRQQQRQQTGGGVGLAGARAAGDHRQPAAQGQGAGHFLPIDGGRGGGSAVVRARALRRGADTRRRAGIRRGAGWRREEPVQPGPGGCGGHRIGLLAAPQQLGRHLLLMRPVTPQVELAPAQHQWGGGIGLGSGGRQTSARHQARSGASALPRHQRAGLQRCQPIVTVLRQGGHHGAPLGHCRGRPAEQGVGVLQQRVDGQATVAAPLQVRQQRSGQHQRRRGAGAQIDHEAGKSAVEPAQPAALGPGSQGLQQGGRVERWRLADHVFVDGVGLSSRSSSAASSASGGGTQ